MARLLPGSEISSPAPGLLVARWGPTADSELTLLAVDLVRDDLRIAPGLSHDFAVGARAAGETLGALRLKERGWAAASADFPRPPNAEPRAVLIDGRRVSHSTAAVWGLAVGADAAAIRTAPRPEDSHFLSGGPLLLLAGKTVSDFGPGGKINRAKPPLPGNLLQRPQNRTAICIPKISKTVYFIDFKTSSTHGGETLERFARRLRDIGCRDALLSSTGDHAGLDMGQEPFSKTQAQAIVSAWLVSPISETDANNPGAERSAGEKK